MSLRDQLRRLRLESRGSIVEIPQIGGTVARFPQSAMQEAFLNECKRLRGEPLDIHPLTRAAQNSSDPKWRDSALAEFHAVGEIEDLSE